MKFRRPVVAIVLFWLSMAFVASAALIPSKNWALGSVLVIGFVFEFVAGVGSFIGYRRPENNVGWVMVGIGLSLSSGLFATQYADRALIAEPGSLPFGIVAAWFQSWLWSALIALFALLLLYFPTGQPPSPRWRIVGRVAVGLATFAAMSQALRSGPFDTLHSVSNPLGIPGVRALRSSLFTILAPALLITYAAVVASMVVRFRRSRGVERRQLKYFVFAVGAAVPLVALNPLVFIVGGGKSKNILFIVAGLTGPLLAVLLLPLTIGVAILRHRLYDINRIISRTLSYAAVTGFLGGLFALLVLGPSLVVGRSGDAPPYIVAGATLIVAALFQPVRRRVQSAVDRRFNRARYDATQTIDRFSGRLRQQIDLDALGTELRGVVAEALHPEHVSLWIKR